MYTHIYIHKHTLIYMSEKETYKITHFSLDYLIIYVYIFYACTHGYIYLQTKLYTIHRFNVSSNRKLII